MTTKNERLAKITRTKLIAPRGSNWRFAWKWLYDVEVEGCTETLAGFDHLETAIKIAKSRGATEIIKSWSVR